jgi:sigma-B regulation protein RsbU (phosphoserine phosphatase)
MPNQTSIYDNPLVRQAPISAFVVLSALLTVALPVLEITHAQAFLASFVVTAIATLVAATAAGLPRLALLGAVLPGIDFIAVALLRAGTGNGASVFTSLVILPVVWAASRPGRWNIVYAAVGVAVVILTPFVLNPDQPPAGSELVRLGITVVVFGLVAVIVHELSRNARRSVAAARGGEEAVRAEIDRAATVQRSLLPSTGLSASHSVTIAGACLPAKTVGGDFFDWYPTPGGIAFSLGDVMGKGVGAGLIAAAVRSTLRSARSVDDASEALKRASDGLAAETLSSEVTFTTLFHARVSDEGVLQWADAGHGLSSIVRADGRVERLLSGDLPLGLGLELLNAWGTTSTVLEPGDVLVTFSDGVLDLFDGDAVDAVAALSREHRDPQALVEALSRRASEVPHDDDVTVVVLRREAAPLPTVAPVDGVGSRTV